MPCFASRAAIRGADAKLTLISALAGFGKITAVVAWLTRAGHQRCMAWLSLEQRDRQPAWFGHMSSPPCRGRRQASAPASCRCCRRRSHRWRRC